MRDISLIDEQSGGIFASYCAKESDEREESRIRSCLKDVEAYGAARRKILSRFKEDVYSLQREAVLSFMKEYREGGFFASRKARKSLIALLSPHYLGVGKPSKKELDAFLDAYSGSASSKGDVEGELSFLREKLGPIDPGDLEGLSRRFEATLKAKGKVRELVASSSSPKKDMNRLAAMPGAFSSEAIRRLSTLLGDYLRLSGELLSDHAFDLNLYKDGDEYFKKEKAKVSACLASSGEMASYFAYLEAKSEAASLAGSEIVSLFEEGKIPPRKLVDAYKNGLALLVASEVLIEAVRGERAALSRGARTVRVARLRHRQRKLRASARGGGAGRREGRDAHALRSKLVLGAEPRYDGPAHRLVRDRHDEQLARLAAEIFVDDDAAAEVAHLAAQRVERDRLRLALRREYGYHGQRFGVEIFVLNFDVHLYFLPK